MRFYITTIEIIIVLCIFSSTKYCQSQAQSSYGSPCIGPDGSTDSCGHLNTFLYCYEGKCKCPDSHLMTSANLPTNLYARWNKDANKCLAISGSSCGIQPSGNKMDCEPGIKCKLSDNSKLGTCGSSQIQISIFLTIMLLVCSVYKLY